LCGAEVTQDYPHEEVDNPGVNHFPDGVFQKCRITKQREKEAERERLRRLRRNRTPAKNPTRVAPSFADDWGNIDSESPISSNQRNANNRGESSNVNQSQNLWLAERDLPEDVPLIGQGLSQSTTSGSARPNTSGSNNRRGRR